MSSFYQAPWPCRYLVDNGTSFRTRRKSRALHFTMTEIVEQRICVKFCKEFGHYCSESIGATRKVTGAIVNGDRNDFALYKLRKLQGKDRQRCGISQSYTRRHENYLWNDLILWSNVVSHWTQRSIRLHRCRFSRIRSVPCREGLNRLFLSALCFALLCFAFLSFFLSFHCPFLWSTNWTKPLGRTDFASPTPRKLAATFPIHFPLFSCSLSDQPIAASNFFEVLLYLSIRNPSVLTPCRRIRENPCTVKAIRLLKRREKSGEKLADWMNEGSIPSRNSKSVRSLGRCHTRRPQTSTKLTGRHAMKEHVRCLYT